MHKKIKTLMIIFLAFTFLTINVNATETVDINYLIEHAKELDGQVITVKGEAVGEEMERKDFSWININDGTNAIGIWLKSKDANIVSCYGNYKYKGDIVKVTGVFHRACGEHGGETDLHNTTIEVIEKGHIVEEHISYVKIITAIVLLGFALLLLLYYYKKSCYAAPSRRTNVPPSA